MALFPQSFATRVRGTIYRHESSLRVSLAMDERSTDPLPLTSPGAGPTARGVGGPITILGHSASKNIRGPGTWSIQLKAGTMDVRREIRVGDWIVLWWVRASEGSRSVKKVHGTLGRIGDVRRARSSAQGATVETWNISGKDFTEVIDKTPFWFDEFAQTKDRNLGGSDFASRMNFLPGGRPDHVVLRLLNGFLGLDGVKGGAWIWPKGMDWLGHHFLEGLHVSRTYPDEKDRIVEELTAPFAVEVATLRENKGLRGELFDEISLFQPKNGVLLTQMLQEWSNPLLNEMFFDLRPTKTPIGGAPGGTPDQPLPFLTLRERPFVSNLYTSDSQWFKLPLHEFSKQHVLQSDIGYSDSERLNLYFLYSQNNGLTPRDQYAIFTPKTDFDDVARHGLRRFERGTKFSGIGGRWSGNFGTEIAKWRDLLTSWYSINPYLLNGTLNFKHVWPEVRVGERIRIGTGKDQETFYVEGVNHTWQYPGAGSTTFQVTRGWVGDEKKLTQLVVNQAEFYRSLHPSLPEVFIRPGGDPLV